jgi:hypothetical protein
MYKKSKKKKLYILYLNILVSVAWVTRRITHHFIFFTCALFRCIIYTTNTTSIYSQSIASITFGPN